MMKVQLENPNGLWTLRPDGVYETPMFAEGKPNSLFNVLPNSPYLTDGRKLRYVGFIEGCGCTTEFDEIVLCVVINGACKTYDMFPYRELAMKNAIFTDEINCSKGALVLVFTIGEIEARTRFVLPRTMEEEVSTKYISRYRVYAQKLGGNKFFAAWSGLNYTYHAFTQVSAIGTARGAHAMDFFQKNVVMHKGAIEMKGYFEEDDIIVETTVEKTDDFYEGYYLHGKCFHSFKVLQENTIDTMFVERSFGIQPKRLPIKALFSEEELDCSESDAEIPSAEQIAAVETANILRV